MLRVYISGIVFYMSSLILRSIEPFQGDIMCEFKTELIAPATGFQELLVLL